MDLLKNKGVDEIQNQASPFQVEYTGKYTKGATGWVEEVKVVPGLEQRCIEYDIKYNEICSKADKNDESQWINYKNEIDFKEAYIDQYANDYITTYAFKDSWTQYRRDVLNVFTNSAPFTYDGGNHTYNKSALSVVDPLVYGIADLTSIGLSPWGLDFIPEGLGLAYASARGQTFEAGAYSAGLVIVGFSGGSLRMIKYGDESIDLIRIGNKTYKKNAKGVFENIPAELIPAETLSRNLGIDNLSKTDAAAFEVALKEGHINSTHIRQLLDETDEVKRLDLFKSLVKSGDEIGEIVGKYNWNLVKRYFQHIQEVTGRDVLQKQIDKLKDALRNKEYKRLSQSEIAAGRSEFNKLKNKLIEQWEKETGQQWPRYTEEVYSKNGTLLRNIGDPYDAHHIIENSFGGPNEWWNIHPAKFPLEHQGGIHGTSSPSRELFN